MTFNVVGGYEADIHPFSGTISGGDRVALWRFYLFTVYRPKTNSIEAVDVFFSSGL
jgi:hypothetical protein